MQCIMKKEDKSMLDVENVETAGERWCNLNWRTPLNSSLCMFIGMKHISPTFLVISYQCIWGWHHLQKPSPQMSFHIFFCYFFPTHISADCWIAHRSPAGHDSFKCVHDWCEAGWRRPSAPPNKNPGYAGAYSHRIVTRSMLVAILE